MQLRVGIIGARRGRGLAAGLRAVPDCEVVAVCDLNSGVRAEAAEALEVEHLFEDYDEMLDSGLINTAVVATPQNLHVEHACMALARGFHVLSEVPAAVDLTQCCRLVDAVRASGGTYMISENANYMMANVIVREMARAGAFGEMYFGEGAYTHDLKDLSERSPWRRRWQTGRNGVTYPTHQLGPVLQWMGQRLTSVSCLGSGHHHEDPRGDEYEQEDCVLMICRTDRGGLVKVRQDIISDRPSITTAYSLQGTEGCYESAHTRDEDGRVWLKGRAENHETWQPLSELAEEFLPAEQRDPPPEAAQAGHGGSDYWVARDFAMAVHSGEPPELDVYFAMDITVPGIISEVSIGLGGAPVPVPDFRDYETGSNIVPVARG